MTDISLTSYDLSTARGRRAMLRSIPPDREIARKYHPQLVDLFRRETDWRRRAERDPEFNDDDPELDAFENLYWCGLLLYLAGNPEDVSLMWEAKQISMDTAGGFDVQYLVGAGVEQTLEYLRENRSNSIAEYIAKCKQSRDFEDLDRWERFRIDYFYGGSLMAPPG
jgi:hypothetical protein